MWHQRDGSEDCGWLPAGQCCRPQRELGYACGRRFPRGGTPCTRLAAAATAGP